jgi:hypothetical protein
MAAINTNIPLSEKETTIYKKFKSLAVNEEPKLQGDGVIKISPFDDYFIFTLYNEIDGENVPIDLSNVGTLFMVFVGANDEIRIPNYTNVQDIDMSAGQVLFKVNKENSKKVLALDNKNFYISTMMIDENGESDESVVYTGTFLSIDEASKKSSTQEIEDLRIQYSKELASYKEQIDSLNTQIAELIQVNEEQTTVINGLTVSNTNLTDEVARLSEALGDAKAEAVLAEARAAQKAEEINRLRQQQVQAIRTASSGSSGIGGVRKKYYYQTAAENLRQNAPGVTPVTSAKAGVSTTFTPASQPPSIVIKQSSEFDTNGNISAV